MQDSTSAYPPEEPGRARGPISQPARVVSLDQAVQERLEQGLREIEDHASQLMREIASEMWRASRADSSPEQDRILSFLSRDQAIKSLITSADERFQTLAVRTARFEDFLTDLSESTRATRQAITDSAAAIKEVANSPTVHGVEEVRTQMEQVEKHIAAAFQHLDERDRALIEGIQIQIREHGELIARETTRIVEAMQGYVQSGTEAMGRLAQRVEAHAETFSTHDGDLSERLRGVIREEIGAYSGQFEFATERMGISQRDELAGLDGLRVALEEKVLGLAQLIRSDSEAIRGLIEERTVAVERGLADVVDEHAAALARTTAEQVAALTNAVTATIDHQIVILGETVQERLGMVTEQVALRAAEAADIAVSSTFDQTMERLNASIDTIESIRSSLEETTSFTEERMARNTDEGLAALAKLIRSDNRVLAERISAMAEAGAASAPGADIETAKLTLRAIKELQATLAADVMDSVDRRFQQMSEQLHKESQAQTETMAKVAEVLATKVDRLSIKIDEGVGSDVQVIADRMGDAIAALGRDRR